MANLRRHFYLPVLAVLLLVVDLVFPLGVASGIPYIAVVLLSLNVDSRRTVLATAGLCTIFVLLGWAASPTAGESQIWKITANRLLAVSAIWMTAGIGLQRIQARKRVLQSQQQMALILDSALDAVITIDTAGIITFWNQQAEALFGWPRAQALGRPLADTIIRECDRAAHVAGLRTFMETGQGPLLNRRVEAWAITRDGREFPAELTICPFQIGHETYFSGFVRDITERRRSAERQSQIAAIVDCSEDAIISTDLSGTITQCNEAAATIYGYSREELVGKSIAILLPPARWTEVDTMLDKIRKGGRIRHQEAPRLTRSGARIFVSQSVSPIKDSSGRVIGAASIARDITHKKLAEIKIRQRKEEIEEFLHIAGHDLNKPLVATIWQLEVLQEEAADGLREDHRGYLTSALSECNKLQTMIGDLERISKLERLQLDKEAVKLNDLIDACLDRVADARERKEVQVERLCPDLEVVICRVQVEEALTNLIENAIKYGCQAAGESITIQAAYTDGCVNISVSDHGPGIPRRHHDRIFRLFARLEPGNDTGSGIGLTAVKRLMRQLGGQVLVDSDAGQGARFTLSLPAGLSEEAPPSPPEDVSVSIGPGNSKEVAMMTTAEVKVFLVEDDPAHARMIQRAIDRAPFACRTVHLEDGLEALRHLNRTSPLGEQLLPDIILLDLSMPHMDGFELLENIREDQHLKSIPVVVVSTSGDSGDVAAAYRIGANAYLKKTSDFEAFARNVVGAISFAGNSPGRTV